ncbi:uncharacterized protein LOC112178434 [Rosa chinensis]|uniref:uncharacterized protein LOC112178434 n=1 Tax=Rosa chinensis TaxID=74649 RepID=UPI000D096FA6|nr:uncharacterized protein LOC112178434 [Rosa chinensis]
MVVDDCGGGVRFVGGGLERPRSDQGVVLGEKDPKGIWVLAEVVEEEAVTTDEGEGMRKDMKQFVATCDQCLRQSYEAINPPGLLNPLPISENVWLDISMDFVDGLPNSSGKNAIMVVVDRLTKYSHFIGVTHPYSAKTIAEVFLKEIFRLHGMPKMIVSDRDPIFLSNFWKDFFKLQGRMVVQHHTPFYYQDDILRSTIRLPTSSVLLYMLGSISVQIVDEALQQRDELLRNLKSNMEFAIGDWVYLKLHPYRQKSLVKLPANKLAPRYYGPFQITARIGQLPYKLALPHQARLHPVFHVSLLKWRIGDMKHVSPTLPPFDESGELIWSPEAILDMQAVKHKKHQVTQWLIKWTGLPVEDATWESAQEIVSRFPSFSS